MTEDGLFVILPGGQAGQIVVAFYENVAVI